MSARACYLFVPHEPANAVQRLAETYTDFVSYMSETAMLLGTWVCVFATHWRACVSFEEAMSNFQEAAALNTPVCVEVVSSGRRPQYPSLVLPRREDAPDDEQDGLIAEFV
jgi:hypothetical protein